MGKRRNPLFEKLLNIFSNLCTQPWLEWYDLQVSRNFLTKNPNYWIIGMRGLLFVLILYLRLEKGGRLNEKRTM